MTTKERLIQELEHAPEDLLEAVLDFVLIAKADYIQESDTPTAASVSEVPDGIASLLRLANRFAAELTAEELAQLPTDGALEHDHYIYGTPKRYDHETGK